MTVIRDNRDNSIRRCLEGTLQVIINKKLISMALLGGPSAKAHLVAAQAVVSRLPMNESLPLRQLVVRLDFNFSVLY